jgi:hypothetical protein
MRRVPPDPTWKSLPVGLVQLDIAITPIRPVVSPSLGVARYTSHQGV